MSAPLFVVVIPTYQEAVAIQQITVTIDRAIQESGAECRFILLNADNNSPDGTAALFLTVATATPKRVELSTAGQRGKGVNLRVAFRAALALGAEGLISLDADLASVPSEWIRTFVASIKNGASMALPLYGRSWNDGSQTNHLVAPLLLGVAGQPIRQPIGGDFALSCSFMRHMLGIRWPGTANGFGVDFFLLHEAVKFGTVAQERLPVGKHHGWRSTSATLVDEEFAPKFEQVALTVLGLLITRGVQPDWGARFPPSPPIDPTLERGCDLSVMPRVAELAHHLQKPHAFYDLTAKHLSTEVLDLADDREWGGILASAFALCERSAFKDEHLESLRALLYARIASTQRQFERLGSDGIDRRVEAVASQVRKVLLSR